MLKFILKNESFVTLPPTMKPNIVLITKVQYDKNFSELFQFFAKELSL